MWYYIIKDYIIWHLVEVYFTVSGFLNHLLRTFWITHCSYIEKCLGNCSCCFLTLSLRVVYWTDNSVEEVVIKKKLLFNLPDQLSRLFSKKFMIPHRDCFMRMLDAQKWGQCVILNLDFRMLCIKSVISTLCYS